MGEGAHSDEISPPAQPVAKVEKPPAGYEPEVDPKLVKEDPQGVWNGWPKSE
jgi:hypothetical protein